MAVAHRWIARRAAGISCFRLATHQYDIPSEKLIMLQELAAVLLGPILRFSLDVEIVFKCEPLLLHVAWSTYLPMPSER